MPFAHGAFLSTTNKLAHILSTVPCPPTGMNLLARVENDNIRYSLSHIKHASAKIFFASPSSGTAITAETQQVSYQPIGRNIVFRCLGPDSADSNQKSVRCGKEPVFPRSVCPALH